jgi:hypothetical protein
MKKLLKSAALMSAVLGLVGSVQAIPISGGLHMVGGASLDSANLGSATKANSFTSVAALAFTGTGSYGGLAPADPVTFKPFGWNPSTAPVLALWKFTDPNTGFTYSFDLATVSVASQSDTFLNLQGTGTLWITGPGSLYDPTFGNWTFTISNPSGASSASFGFDSAVAAVPDGGTTVILLGAALSSLAMIRRKLA